MTRSKRRKSKVPAIKGVSTEEEEEEVKTIPIDNLPENYLWMRIKYGTKIRNVLEYAFKHFPEHRSIVWTGVGQSINKTISCSQLFKRQNPGLHQVTRLRYVPCDKKSTESGDSAKRANRHVAEIHILLSTNPTHAKEPGYQSPEDPGAFAEPEPAREPGGQAGGAPASSSGRIASLPAEGLAATRAEQRKRPWQEQQKGETPAKKNKKKEPAAKGRRQLAG